MEWTEQEHCEFCRIVARLSPGRIRYEDEEVMAFDNVLRWVPVMILVVPKRHMSQEAMWSDPVLGRIGQVAIKLGQEHCPHGFRLLSNLGWDALQSQSHGHLHLLGGTELGRYS